MLQIEGVAGARVARELNAGRSTGELAAVCARVASRDVLVAALRAELNQLVDDMVGVDGSVLPGTYEASPEELDAVAVAIASGVDSVVAVSALRRRPDAWMGIPAAWGKLVSEFAMASTWLERVAIVPEGVVSDLLAFDRDHGDFGPVYCEFSVELLPRVALGGGLEAVVLPRVVEGVRTYRLEAGEDGRVRAPFSGDLPASTFLEVDGSLLDPELLAAVLSVPGLSARSVSPRRLAASRPVSRQAPGLAV